MSHNGGRWINDEQYLASYDLVMELNNLKTMAFHLGEDKKELQAVVAKLLCALDLIRETLRGGNVDDLAYIINTAIDEAKESL